jgi:hypothetical protein
MRKIFARIHNVLAWLIFAGCILQIFLISLAYFGAIEVSNHAFSGFLISVLALFMFISSLIVRSSGLNVILSLVVLLLLIPVQGLLAYSDELPNAVQGLHGLNGMLIMGLSYSLATSKIKATNYEENKVVAAEAVG